MPEPKTVVRSVLFNSDGSVDLTYLQSQDLKENGLILTHTLSIPLDPEYAEEIDGLHDNAVALLEDALEDHGRLEAWEPETDTRETDDDDDEDDDE